MAERKERSLICASLVASAVLATACAGEEAALHQGCKVIDDNGLSTCGAGEYCTTTRECLACEHAMPLSADPHCLNVCTGPAPSDYVRVCLPDARCDLGDSSVCANWIEVVWRDGRMVGLACEALGEVGGATGVKGCAIAECPATGGLEERYGDGVDPWILAARLDCTCPGPAEGPMTCGAAGGADMNTED